MAYRLPPLPVLRAFEAAARHLSFKKAAEELHVTPAAVSQQIKALESYLDLPLFRRLTRALELTEHGAAMLPKIREGFECLAAAVEAAGEHRGGALTVTAPPSFATHWLLSRLPRFAAAHPEIALRLASSPDSVDRRGETAILDEALVDLRGEASTVAIRYGTGIYPGYWVERLFAPVYVPVCSPKLLAGRPPLRTPADLGRQVLIHDETIDDGERPIWDAWLQAAGADDIDAERGPHFSNAALAIEAAVAGQGVALAAKPLVEDDVAAGRLAIPFAVALPSPYAYFLVTAEAVARRPPVAAFRQWLLAEAAAA
ncbi:MAG TPA: transcriptional regulator GcvA [Rhodocyclaceae bacterium]|nr:transcriptional regulator GcvA [Rhodocyclaceae bacterium]